MNLQEARRNVVFFPDPTSGTEYGCGFFITPRSIITAGHVVKYYSVGDQVDFLYQGSPYTATLVNASPNPYQELLAPDVALLETDQPIGPDCAYTLDLPLKDEQLTVCVARPDGQIEECDVEQDGWQSPDGIPDTIGLTPNTAMVPGWSGAPVFRRADSCIMGYLRIMGGDHAEQGGCFVPLARIVEALPELQLQTTYEASQLPDTLDHVVELLSYTSRLTPFIGSMNEELDILEEWAIGTQAHPYICLISGPGGSGKSRLAYELIQRLRQRGIPADFFGDHQPILSHALVVIDYPEQNIEQINRYLEALSAQPVPIRVLLLSRRPLQDLREDILIAGAGHLLDGHSVSISPLTNIEVSALYRTCSEALEQKYSRSMPVISDNALWSWISQNAALHTLPLFVRALALEVALTGEPALGFTSERLLRGLVDREGKRLRKASLGVGFAEESLLKLSAFAAIRQNLSWTEIKSFQNPEFEVFTAPFGSHKLMHLPWFQGDSWLAPTPDIVAAALVYTVFKDNEHLAPLWLWKLLEGAEPSIVANMGRLLSDMENIFGSGQNEFTTWLKEIIRQDPEHAAALREFTTTSAHSLGDFAAAVGQVLVHSETSDLKNRAEIILTLANNPGESGDAVGANTSSEKSTAMRPRLVKANPSAFEPDLASSYNTLSHSLRDSGDRVGALNAIEESVAIYQKLCQANPAAFEADLAAVLNTLSTHLRDNGDREGGLKAIEASVAIYRRLARANPAAFEADLALVLKTLSNSLRDNGDRVGALKVIQESVAIYESLAKTHPAAFESEQASVLNTLSMGLRDSGDRVGALKAIQESVAIYQRLAKANPAAFEAELALVLNTFSMSLRDSGDRHVALKAIEESVAIYQRLAKQNPPAFEADLARSLNTLAMRARDSGDRVGALKAIQEAVAIYQRLATDNPAAFEAELAYSLSTLSNGLSDSGDRVRALKASQDAVAIYQRLAGVN